MTSPCEVHIYASNKSHCDEVAKKILRMAKGLEQKYNFYDPNSYLSTLNQRKTNLLDAQTKDLLSRAKLFYTQTKGIFDITAGTLTQSRKLPTLDEVEKEMKKLEPFVGVEHFKIKKNKLIFDNPHTLIDLGGFVKEYAVDVAVKILKKEKIASALVNFGGDIYALGLKPNGEKFSIGIKNPKNPQEYISNVKISNEALTTSASYERKHKVEGKEYSHIISKNSLQKEIISATVIASTVVEAGVSSTALMVEPQLTTSLKRVLIGADLEVCEL